LQSVRSAIAWSYRLLRDDERAVFARLGVFRGGCSAEAAEAIVPDRAGREVRAVLTSLAAKSLVRRVSTADGQSRYFMLDTVREFAEEVLQQKGELQEVRSRHFSYFAEESTRGEFHDNPQAWLKRWDPDVNNVRAALWWGVDHGDRETLLRFAYKIGSYFYARTSQREGIEWLERALHVSAGAPESLLLAARQLLGNLQFTGGDVVPACDTLEDVLARYRDLDDLQAAAECMCVLAAATLEKGDFARCEQVSVEQLQYARARTDAFLEGTALNRLGEVAMERGDFAGARELLYMSVDALHRQANTLELAHARSGIAKVHTALGEFDAAQEILDAVLDAVVRVGSQGHIGGTMINRAVLALYRGDLDASAALFEQALPVCVEIGMGPNLSRCLRGCGKVALERGRLDAASDFLHRVVRRDLELGMTPNLVYDLREVAALAAECGQPVRAAVLFGAVAAQHQALGMALWPVEKPLHRRHRDSARSVLERETWDQAGRRGGSMSLAEAATYALSADPLPAGSLG
jgi:tetratricopeptide (TPR) repeat protein